MIKTIKNTFANNLNYVIIIRRNLLKNIVFSFIINTTGQIDLIVKGWISNNSEISSSICGIKAVFIKKRTIAWKKRTLNF